MDPDDPLAYYYTAHPSTDAFDVDKDSIRSLPIHNSLPLPYPSRPTTPPTTPAKPKSRLLSYIPSSLTTRLFVAIVFLQTAIALSIQGFLFAQYYDLNTTFHLSTSSASEKRLPVNLAIFGLAHCFLLLMALDAVQSRNVIQIFGLVLFNALFLGYSIIQIDEIRVVFGDSFTAAAQPKVKKVPVELLTSLIPGMIGLCELGYLTLSWFVYKVRPTAFLIQPKPPFHTD